MSNKSILAVFGASGNQGYSLAHHVLTHPTLSKTYTVRALSRTTSHPLLTALSSLGAQTAYADMSLPLTLAPALTGVTHLFLLTTTFYTGNTRTLETQNARNVCTEAVKQGVRYIIFSSAAHASEITDGKLSNVEHFDVKAEIEAYIRSLPIQSAFFAPASFMQNLHTHMRPQPSGEGDGSYVLTTMLRDDTKVPFIDILDTGKFVGAILAEPQRYAGKYLAAAEGFYTLREIVAVMARVTGKTVRHVQLEDEIVKARFPEGLRGALGEMWILCREYGYFGKEQEELVKWAKEQVEGKLTGMEEFLRMSGFNLE
ncbi:NmrA family transcriptional regulator [Pyrenophora tritici-repentis]|uniref:NmrA family transcriptional regulator n=2 Tax=Pyrenophora tritici-repentis TaxID=45151 RepID=A0A2W1GDU0_9PLEO|nr:uncharacterized protein PTRG_10598 [Pyrenophora tritici-repentis Pt-1C-BFP]KAA8621265.1 NmrA family transcriptional regulator [Pyrenophora tritici-repentis]EDU43648.1 conserved hypothetical protein [Pyrenophora tritici-repentis Pt-1C-BFP]KAF7450500.1 NmrA family transcriptional regulator [Pyrenophora tritici-repentis]KAF7573116.1 NmrA family transcriptional regulator [Pyrenophora tritici-repentis]KAG9381278.1 NmrA family transcriptional regulator [Pyrenophora tritici-repentis]